MNLSLTLWNITTRPLESVILRWNWKSAFTSALVRALIFYFANLSAGWRAATTAMLAEYAYRAITSGFYGALTQNFSRVQPAWQAAIAAMICLPACQHTLEFLVHWLRHTPNLRTSIFASVCLTALSTLFHWYAMRQGIMIVGENASSLAHDMRRMPHILAGFVASGPISVWRLLRNSLFGRRSAVYFQQANSGCNSPGAIT
jgi:hypothetical protein